MLDFGRDVTNNPQLAHRREWLVTNGIGGYATGTISGILSRVYHGLLVAALKPPLGRTVLLSKFDETLTYDGIAHEVFSDQWSTDEIDPHGYRYIERFRLEGTTPVWTFAVDDARLEKRVWMQHHHNTTYIRYDYVHGTLPLTLLVQAMVTYKDSHHVIRKEELALDLTPIDNGVLVKAGDVPFRILSDSAQMAIVGDWYEAYHLAVEQSRGLPDTTDNYYAVNFTVTLEAGQSVTFAASTEDEVGSLDSATAYRAQQQRERDLIQQSELQDDPAWIQQLVLAADQFIVRRQAGDNPDGRTVIAGYHWFGDWGRDTMIALPGLTLATKRYDEAASILRTFATFVNKGMLPNRFPDYGETPEYNTVDATLWYFAAIQQYYDATGDMTLLRDLYPTLQEIITWHQNGTRYHIHVDPDDGLLSAGEAGVQLTWMDVKINDWVVTPRTGKPVEINALWYNALRSMADFARLLGDVDADEYDTLANHVERSFGRFWNEQLGYCFDVLDMPNGMLDASLRPNQLFAISLEYSPLTPEQQQSIVDICGRKLLTSMGLRTLAPEHPSYKGDYGGNPYERDSRYHQGTVWAWLMGAYVAAHLKVYNDKAAARYLLEPFKHHLADYGVGSIAEVAQGDMPHLPKATIAQAWSVAEILRAWLLCKD